MARFARRRAAAASDPLHFTEYLRASIQEENASLIRSSTVEAERSAASVAPADRLSSRCAGRAPRRRLRPYRRHRQLLRLGALRHTFGSRTLCVLRLLRRRRRWIDRLLFS